MQINEHDAWYNRSEPPGNKRKPPANRRRWHPRPDRPHVLTSIVPRYYPRPEVTRNEFSVWLTPEQSIAWWRGMTSSIRLSYFTIIDNPAWQLRPKRKNTIFIRASAESLNPKEIFQESCVLSVISLFSYDRVKEAHANGGYAFTDPAQIAEQRGYDFFCVSFWIVSDLKS